MAREFSELEANRHNALTSKGWMLCEGRLFLQGQEPATAGWFSRWQLRRAIGCFEQALAINPEGWSSMYALGKIHQRLGDQARALAWFAKAHALNPEQPDVAREAGLAALDVGQVDLALAMCKASAALDPDDAGLVCNLALAYCLAGDDDAAMRCATDAAARDAADPVTSSARQFISEVASGARPRPRTLAEAFPHY